jgi:DNA-binding NarL/FixJ family response regulator
MELSHEQSGTDIRVILASGSRFFLRGLCGILEDVGGISVVAQASNDKEVKECLIKTEADFLFIDSPTLKIGVSIILETVSTITPPPKVICLCDKSTEGFVFPNVEYLTKQAGSSELIEIIKGNDTGGFVPTGGLGENK